MGVEYYFYVQQFLSGRWNVPEEFVDQKGGRCGVGRFTWIDDQDERSELFWGEKCLFPMRADFPPDFEHTSLFQRHYFDGDIEGYSGWLPYEELLMDDWDTTTLLVAKRVEARYAPLFSDGQQFFPARTLHDAGMSEDDVDRLRNATSYEKCAIVDEAIGWMQGKYRNQLEWLEPSYLVEVTWKETISSFMGDWRTEDFRRLRQYGRDEELRIICILS